MLLSGEKIQLLKHLGLIPCILDEIWKVVSCILKDRHLSIHKSVRFLWAKLELLFVCTVAVWTTDKSWNMERYILYREYSTDR
jgi:hypothetical protein